MTTLTLNHKAAKGIAANIAEIVKAQTRLTLLDDAELDAENTRHFAEAAIKKAQGNIELWLQQPICRGDADPSAEESAASPRHPSPTHPTPP